MEITVLSYFHFWNANNYFTEFPNYIPAKWIFIRKPEGDGISM